MVEYEFISQSQIDMAIEGAGTMGFAVGLLFGILIFATFYWFFKQTNMKGFKMWLLQLPEKDRLEIKKHLDDAEKVFGELTKSNTKLFKTYYNELCELKTFIQKKFMQS